MAKMVKRGNYAAPALERGLDLVEALARAHTPLTQAELARAVGNSSSSIFRMLALLEERGYLLKDHSTGRYALTLRFYALAHARNPIEALVAAARAPMESLSASIGESCHLSVLRGSELLILAQAHGPGAVRLSIEPGSSFPAAQTASGQLLVALLPEEVRCELFPRAPLHQLRKARAAGWVVAHDQTILGVHDLAVRVPLPGGDAALTVSWLTARGGGDKSRRFLPKLVACSQEIVTRLGVKGIGA